MTPSPSPSRQDSMGQHQRREALVLLLLLLPWAAAAAGALAEGEAAAKPVDLEAAAFDAALQALPAGRGVLLEFYANWCPACQHFAPHYEKVAAFFHGAPPPKPEVYVARVDCATEVRPRPAGAGRKGQGREPYICSSRLGLILIMPAGLAHSQDQQGPRGLPPLACSCCMAPLG